jgi:hypothetical protein
MWCCWISPGHNPDSTQCRCAPKVLTTEAQVLDPLDERLRGRAYGIELTHPLGQSVPKRCSLGNNILDKSNEIAYGFGHGRQTQPTKDLE